MKDLLNDPIFQETDFEKMFMESVHKTKSKKQQKGR
mgnify:CR=1 FL=1